MPNNEEGFSFPSHMPYEDGWKFCEVCQRFYKTNSETCPHDPAMRLREKSLSGNDKMRRVWDNGLGLPVWAQMREFTSTPEGKEAVKSFLNVQEKLLEQIRNSPNYKRVTYGKLGAEKFRNHWFIKK